MRNIVLFVEDYAHKEFLSALLQRLAAERRIVMCMDWRNARRGHGAVVGELKQFLRDIQVGRIRLPDLLVVATDANCKGVVERLRQITEITAKVSIPTICAVPNPHIERWMLVDSSAFKAVFGRGCAAPDQKCDRARYKKLLGDAIRASGILPSLGGIEFSNDIVQSMDLARASAADDSLGRFIEEVRTTFKQWQP